MPSSPSRSRIESVALDVCQPVSTRLTELAEVEFTTGPKLLGLDETGAVELVDPSTGGGTGVTDHGALTGLGDDDHLQYLNATRGDARYYIKAAADAAFAAISHGHTVSQLSDASANGRSLISAADFAAMRSLLSLVVGTHVLAPNGNGSGLTGITQSQIANLTTDLAGKLSTTGNGSGLTGLTVSQLSDASANGRSLISAANYAAMLSLLSVYSSEEVDTLVSETSAGLQPLDATLVALSGWNWSSGVEVVTMTAADTRGVLRVGTGANNLVQLTSDGKLPAVDGSLLTGIAGGGASNLDGLSDVTITAAASGDFLRHNGTAWVDSTISASDIPSGVDATKIGGGAVSNTEFSYLDGVTSAIQTQLDAKAAAAAYEYAWPSDAAESFTSGTYKAILTTSSLAVGCYEVTALVNTRRAAAATIWTRWIAGTASLAGSVNDALGHAMLEGSTITQVTLSSTSPWTTTAPGRFSSGDGATHLWRIAFEVTSAGTVSLQMAFNTTNNVTIEKGSVVTIRKVS